MRNTSDAMPRRRLETFSIQALDLDMLATFASYARDRLPALLVEAHHAVSAWPEIVAALRQPDLHDARVAHRQHVIQGRFGGDFLQSCTPPGKVFLAHQAPAYAVVLCRVDTVLSVMAEANAGVQTVAAEQLSASEIKRQVAESTGVAARAVEEARRTDAVAGRRARDSPWSPTR